MKTRIIAVYAGAFLLAGALQGTLLDHIKILGVKPDLILIVVIIGGLLAKTEGGMLLGFAGGYIQGALVGVSQPSFIISRLIPGYLAGLMESRVFRENLLVPPFAVLVGTLIGELVYLLFSPPTDLIIRFRAIAIEAGMNTVLAPFVYLILLRLLRLRH